MSNTTTATKSEVIVLGEFGNGRHSPAMKELYKDTQRLLGFSEHQAHVIAKQLGVDVGNLNKGSAGVKFGTYSEKNNTMTLKETVESIKFVCTNSIAVGKICAELDKLRKVGIKSCDSIELHDSIMLWIDDKASELEKTIAAQ